MVAATTTARCSHCGATWTVTLDMEPVGDDSYVIEASPADHVCRARTAKAQRGHLRRVS